MIDENALDAAFVTVLQDEDAARDRLENGDLNHSIADNANALTFDHAADAVDVTRDQAEPAASATHLNGAATAVYADEPIDAMARQAAAATSLAQTNGVAR